MPHLYAVHFIEICKEKKQQKKKQQQQQKKETRKKKSLAPGVVYLSRIPPFMQPHKVRHFFSPFGTVGRIYLQPEGG